MTRSNEDKIFNKSLLFGVNIHLPINFALLLILAFFLVLKIHHITLTFFLCLDPLLVVC